MITFSNIVDRFDEFTKNHFFLKTFSFGSPADLDLDKFENYPLLHLVYTSSSYNEKVKSYSFEVYILDCPRGEEDRKEFEKDVITQSEMCAEDILADLENGGAIFDFDFSYLLESATTTPLAEQESNVLSGTLLSISIGVPYLYDSCNAPLSGVSPQGSSTTYSARGLLRVKEVDGTPDVTTVKTITVSNGTLTDNGNGAVTILTTGATTSTASFTFPSSSMSFPPGLTTLNFGSATAGTIVYTSDLTKGWALGFLSPISGTALGFLPVNQGSTITVAISYTIEANTVGLTTVNLVKGGQADAIDFAEQTYFTNSADTRTITTTDGITNQFSLTNTMSLSAFSTSGGTFTPISLIITCNHT
tara:strand:- start:1040 stop:2122 length:1083 start_codon:yes stop_codon:yes gene_type:complete